MLLFGCCVLVVVCWMLVVVGCSLFAFSFFFFFVCVCVVFDLLYLFIHGVAFRVVLVRVACCLLFVDL